MNTLKDSLVEYLIILSKKLIMQSDLTLQINCENDYRRYLSAGIDLLLKNQTLASPEDEAAFFKSKDFITLEVNTIRFVSGWINDAKEHNETTLHESTLARFKNWCDRTFCPGFIPFC